MNEVEIAAGAVMAAQNAAQVVWERNIEEMALTLEGSRARTCTEVNSPKIHEAVGLLEKAARLLIEVRDRQARMIDA